MKTKELLSETTNRYEYNRLYKIYQCNIGKLKCTYCKYHSGSDNTTTKWYNVSEEVYNYYLLTKEIPTIKDDSVIPNWKLFKKSKQWIKTDFKFRKKKDYYEIII